jgi:hypothetical protein
MIELLPAGRKRNGIDGSEHNLTHAILQKIHKRPLWRTSSTRQHVPRVGQCRQEASVVALSLHPWAIERNSVLMQSQPPNVVIPIDLVLYIIMHMLRHVPYRD